MAIGKRDYYEILGVGREADDEEIKRAYRKLAMQYHPDRNHGDAAAELRFKEVTEAYEVLRDPEKRQRYDRYGHAGLEGVPMPDFSQPQSMFDLLNELMGGAFGERMGGGPQRGRHLTVDLTLDLAEAYHGTRKSITIPREEVCGDCNGRGARRGTQPKSCRRCGGRGFILQRMGFLPIQQQQTCPGCGGRGAIITDPCLTCHGAGRIEVRRSLEVNVPRGVDNGMTIRLQGEGDAGDLGAHRGDLYCRIHVREHPLFRRDGNHLVCQVPITVSQAALGGELEVPTLDGKVRCHLKRGTQHGDVLKVPGKGMPHVQGGRPGDLLVQVVIEIPRQLTPRQEELFRELAEIDQKHVSPQRKSFLDKLCEFFTAQAPSGTANEER